MKTMIVYNKLWQTMKEKKISQYTLIKDYKISNGQLHRLRRNQHVSTYTLNRLCSILDCRLSDIAEYIRDEETLP
jgi:DNA-binding Xre family transcriptional regulator